MATSTRLSTVTTERTFVPKPSGKPDPTAHLSAEQVEALGRELDALRQEVFDSRGEADAAYIRRVITAQRALELGSRAVLLFSLFPPAWIVGTAGLSVAKILENMEIGHNVMHGQWDWMRDPKIHSTAWEWDNASPSDLWKHSHNELHHTFTNVLGRDNDLGYGIMRVDEDQKWYPSFVLQPLWNFLNACFFEYGIAAYDLELGKHLHNKTTDDPTFRKNTKAVLHKIRRQMTKDYVVHPLLSGPSFLHTLAANGVANLVRNLWTHSVIMCGHFPEGVETFAKESIDGETRGEWYLRQMLGSANIRGSKAMHIATGNLSHQIEHHLFPDMPSNRYHTIAPQIRDICERYGISYVTGTLPQQVASAWREVFRMSLPNDTSAAQTAAMLAKGAARSVRSRVGAAVRRRTGASRTPQAGAPAPGPVSPALQPAA
ncbi:fatty acid desaturase [Aquipuribacter sp. SD81]|uniref:fatty acid desaturase family protein n=1 Tax=Aquipuribacter sp. SD81 TaxID=3127703 RepID=UPI003FA60738